MVGDDNVVFVTNAHAVWTTSSKKTAVAEANFTIVVSFPMLLLLLLLYTVSAFPLTTAAMMMMMMSQSFSHWWQQLLNFLLSNIHGFADDATNSSSLLWCEGLCVLCVGANEALTSVLVCYGP